MMTLDQLDKRLNQILNDFSSFEKLSDIKRLYEEIKKQVPQFPTISEKIFEKDAVEAARNLSSNYAIYLYKQRIKDEGVNLEAERKKLHAHLYDKNWNEFYQMVQLEDVEQVSKERPKFESSKTIVYNLEGYDEGVTISPPSNSELGAPLALNTGVPIGYVINIPRGEIKGIEVSAYGGTRKEERKERLNKPGALSLEDQALLANGIAVVNLNLVDLLKLAVYQNVMTEQLHTELHQSINHFWETIHSKPETLSPLLSDMKDKPIFLRGASWGGRTAIRHAELFPNTFSGYISFDGSISSEMTSKSDRSLVGTRQGALAHLDPASHIQDIQDPILLIHNANDNNVNLKVSLDFYEKAKHEGKENLLSVHINQKGDAYEGNQGVWNTGHFTPNSDQAEFEHQVNAVSNFIIHGPDKLPELTNWRTVKYNSISDRNYNLASSSDLFVEYVNRTFKKDLPDHESLSRIFSVFELISKENADFIRSAFNSRIPDAELEAGLIKELKGINSYFREKFDIEFDEKIIPEMLNKYRDSILKADAKLHRELLLTFILANPHYVDKIHNYVSRKFGYDDYKRDTFIKLIKQRTAFRSASKTTLRVMLERGLAHEKQIETQIKNGDVKSLRNLISAYNASGNPKALSERLERILVEMPEDTKRDMLYKMGSELIADLSIRYEIFEVIRNAMTPDQYENLVINSKSNINAMMSDWSPVAQTERLMSTFKNTKSELRKEFLSINLLKNVSAEQLVNLMSDFSDDEVYELFGRVEGKKTALSEKHDISYLEYVNERVGDERFKKLLEFDVGERL
ncbi:MAG: alpha/beta hydrolase family protein, partial [Candidatus Berkiella sp.]